MWKGSPKSDQQGIEILSILTSFFFDWIVVDGIWVDGDLLKVLRSDGLEGHGNRFDPRHFAFKRQISELCGAGEVEGRYCSSSYINEQW